jgi:hypothetical protein
MLHLVVVLVTSSATMRNDEAVDDVSKVVFFFSLVLEILA